MENLPTFISNNILLVMAFLVVLIMLLMNIFGPAIKGYKVITPALATHMINKEDALILDIRQDNEFVGGHIVNAKHIPLSFLNDRLSELEKHKNKPVIAVCRTGHRSSHACSVLKKAGFESVYNLSGGVLAWENANLPLTKS